MRPEIDQALKRIDQIVSVVNLSREQHVRLAMDIELIRKELTNKVEKPPEMPPKGRTKKEG